MDSHEGHRHLSMSYHPMSFHDAGFYLLQEYLTHGTEKVCKPGYDVNLSIYALKIQDNLSNEVFFTPAEI